MPGKSDGDPCHDGGECLSGVCEGQGCGAQAGRCVPGSRACTGAEEAFCTCDGATFRAPADCPGQPFSGRGECSGQRPR